LNPIYDCYFHGVNILGIQSFLFELKPFSPLFMQHFPKMWSKPCQAVKINS
jgi:hypothetical protein